MAPASTKKKLADPATLPAAFPAEWLGVMEATAEEYDLRDFDRLSLALISDTHGEVAPEIVEVVSQCDGVLHAGDIMGQSVLDQLKPRKKLTIAVRGNNDFDATWCPRGGSESAPGAVSAVPEVAMIRCVGGDIAMEHGHRLSRIEVDHYRLGYKYPEARLVIYGHTHVQRSDFDCMPWLVNPGVAGFIRNQGGASCCVLHINGDDWRIEQRKFPVVAKAS